MKKYLIGFIFFVLNIVLLLYIVKTNINYRFFVAIIVELLFILSFILSNKVKKIRKLDFEKKFIILFIIIGLFYLLLFPIGSLPDEINHFMRSYEVSKGDLISKKCNERDGHYDGCNTITEEIYQSVFQTKMSYKTLKNNLKIKYNKKSKERYYTFTNISMYSFICYLPQALGILLGRLLHLPILIWAYLARLFNFILFSFLLYKSIRIIPNKKTSIMFIALLPITIQEAVSMSADCMAIGSSIMLISYVLYLNSQKTKVNKKQLAIIGLISLMVSMSKIVYLPICLFTVILSKDKFKNVKSKYIILGLIITIVGILNLIWLKIASNFLFSIEGGFNPSLQLDLIIHKPWKFAIAAFNTTISLFDYFLNTSLGSRLGVFDIVVSPIYIKINIVILILLLLFDNEKIKYNKVVKIISLLIFVMVTGLIYTSLYLDWTPVGKNIIDGIQGRYFTPILLLLFIGLTSNTFKMKQNNYLNKKTLLFIMFLENIYVLTYLYNYY